MSWQDILKKKPKPKSPRKKAIERAKKKGLSTVNKPQRLQGHKIKSHHVMAWDGKKSKYNKAKWSRSKTKEPKNKKWRKGS